jgi:ATP-dependent helicase HrpA
VPEPLLDALDAEQLAWLVPGLRLEKVIALFRELPKAQRKQLVPVPEHARKALEELPASPRPPGFHEWLSEWISRRIGEPVSAEQLAALPLPDHLRMNLRVVDPEDHVLAEGRDLIAIRKKLHGAPAGNEPRQGTLSRQVVSDSTQLHRCWDFGELPEARQVERNRLQLTVYPALKDQGTGVALVEGRNAASAESLSRAAVVRLAMLALPQQVKLINRRMADDRELVLLSRGLTLAEPLADALTQRAFRECFLPNGSPLPRTQAAFEEALDAGRASLSNLADELAAIVKGALQEWRVVRTKLDALPPGFADTAAEIHAQVSTLLPRDFIETTARPWLDYLPRYLRAIARRLERLPANARRDAELAGKVRPFSAAVSSLAAAVATAAVRPELEQLRWMTEEFRVSLYAQDLKTAVRVSEKRLAEQLERARLELRG